MEASTSLIPSRSPQNILRAWVAALADEGHNMSSAMLLPLAQELFGGDPEFIEALLEYSLPGLVTQAMNKALADKRAYAKRGAWYVNLEEEEAKFAVRFGRWYETGRDGLKIPLKRMTYLDLRYAVDQRQIQLEGQLQVIAFLSKLLVRSQLAPNKTVEELFTDDELAEIGGSIYDQEANV